jgi:hypothetical protein
MAHRPYNYDRYDREYEQEDRERERNPDFIGRDWMTNEPRYGQRGHEGDVYRGRPFGGGRYSNEFGSGYARDLGEARDRWNQIREDWGRNREYGREAGRESWDRPFESGRTRDFGDYDRNRQYGSDFERNRSFEEEDRPRFGLGRYDEGRGRFAERSFWRGRGYNPGFGSSVRESIGYGQGFPERSWGEGRTHGQGGRDFGQTYGSVFRNDYEDYGRFDRERGRSDFDRQRGGGEESVGESIKNFFGIGPKGYKRSDDRVRDEVSERLEDHPWIDASEIEVIVKEGEVTLTGTVDSRIAKRLAEDVVENSRGVKDVHNQIRVQPRGAIGSTGAGSSVTGHRPPTSAGKDKDKERAA